MGEGQYGRSWLDSVVAQEQLREGPPLQLLMADPFRRRNLEVPAVRLVDDDGGPKRLVWQATDIHLAGGDPVAALLDFMALESAPDAEIARYASKWGPLGICRHGRPYTHSVACTPLSYGDEYWQPNAERFPWIFESEQEPPQQRAKRTFWEPFNAWRHYARHFAGLFTVARICAAGGRPPSAREWLSAAPWQRAITTDVAYNQLVSGKPYPPEGVITWSELEVLQVISESDRHPRDVIGRWIEILMQEGRIVPTISWEADAKSPEIALSFGPRAGGETEPGEVRFEKNIDSTFSLLVSALVALIQRPDDVYHCSNCNKPVIRAKKPQSGRNVYCGDPECLHVGEKLRKKKYAASRRERERRQQRTPPDAGTWSP